MAEFWAMTPRELTMAFEAAAWRREQAHQRDAWLAWHVAALTRAKRLPPLRRLIKGPGKTRRLEGAEAERRRQEFEELKERMGKHG